MTDATQDAPKAMGTCPQCRCESVSLPHARLLWVCGICGAPRIPVDLGSDAKAKAALAEPGREERRALLEAHRAAAAATFAGAGAVALVLTTIIPTFLAVVVSGLALQVFLGALAGTLLVLALVLRGRGKRARARVEERLRSAWISASARILEAKSGAVTPEELAEITHTEPERAESLLVELSATDRVRIASGDAVAFEPTRIDEASETPGTTDDDDASDEPAKARQKAL